MEDMKFNKWIVALFVAILIDGAAMCCYEPDRFWVWFTMIAFSFIVMVEDAYREAKKRTKTQTKIRKIDQNENSI